MKSNGKSRQAVFSVILAGVLWGIISIFIKNLSAGGIDALQISFVRMAVAAPLFTIFILIKDKAKLCIKPKDIWIFIGTGVVSVVLFNIFYFYTMIKSQASIAVVLLYTSPVFVMLLSAIFFKEKITGVKVMAVLLTLAGCVLVAGLAGGGYTVTPVVLLTGLGAGLFYALYTIFGRVALEKYDTLTVTVWTFLMGLPAAAAVGKPVQTVSALIASPRMILFGIGIGIFSTVLPYFFYTSGLKYMDGGKAAILVAVEPIVGAVIGMTVYGESRGAGKIAGIALILAAIVLLNIPKKNKTKGEINNE